jgi:GAF domain-containing protein
MNRKPSIIRHDDLQGQLRQQAHDLEEARAQQTATAEVLQVINSSRGDLTLVFDTILEKAHRLCGAAKGALVTYDGEVFRAVATRGVSHEYATMLRAPQDNPPESPPHLLLQGERFVQIPDMGELDFPIPRAAASLEGVRTVLFIPLRKEDAFLGYITVYRQEVRPFTDRDIALLENFAAQAVIAIENTRLLNELHQRTDDLSESLEQQTATSEVLRVIGSSPGELQQVFDAILENATRICAANLGHMYRYDGEAFTAVAAFNIVPKYAEFVNRGPVRVEGRHIPLAQIARKKQTVHLPDMRESVAYAERDPLAVAVVDAGYRTVLAVPILKESELIGVIIISRLEVRPFTDKQIALVQNFAAQAVIAIENTRLLNDLSESLQQQTATSEVLGVISASPGELKSVFEAMLDNATRICGAQYGVLWQVEGQGYRSVAVHGMTPAYNRARELEPVIYPGPEVPLARLALTKQMLQVADIRIDESYIKGFPPIVNLADNGGARTLLMVPMLKENELIGAIAIFRQEVKPFSPKQIGLLTNFAAQAVIAIENTRLLSELRESLQQQTATADVLKVISRCSICKSC